MRFFSRLTVICYCSFILAIILRIVEFNHQQKGDFSGVLKLQPVEATFVILGYLVALVVGFCYFLVCLYYLISGKFKLLPKRLAIFNMVMFVIQIVYFSFF
ncbi:hypothetical protein [Ferruginibacter albus]|uniref:hypothetical protein n=1 Tax=Ferruginibacter albus TaxID=2875540 RepID=UPI001CC6460A|nr:hypothetical protein [Ferruginibacter albus]UAY53420.1 hypothetical protein K9M53_07040 [Ferruginibacter albus]